MVSCRNLYETFEAVLTYFAFILKKSISLFSKIQFLNGGDTLSYVMPAENSNAR